MSETIRQHVKRRVRLTAVVLAVGMAAMLYLLDHRVEPWARSASLPAFAAMAVGLIWSGWVNCPRCGYLFSRNEFARFAWPSLPEPDNCPHCGISLDSPRTQADRRQ
jgi:hypothetical protein